MNDQNQKQLGKTLWNIADTLRDAMNADDFRDYMLSFLFLRYLSEQLRDGYEEGAWARLPRSRRNRQWRARPPICLVQRAYLVKPGHLWTSIARMARTPNDELLNTLQAGFKFIENKSLRARWWIFWKSISALQARPDTR